MTMLVKLWKTLQGFTKQIIGIAGILLVIILCLRSIVFLVGGDTDKAQFDLQPLVSSPTLAWIWIGTFIIFVIRSAGWLIGEIRKGIARARDSQLSIEEKAQSLFWWIIKYGFGFHHQE